MEGDGKRGGCSSCGGGDRGGRGGFFDKCKPYIAMICLQFGYAGMNVLTKVSLNRGMSHYVLVVYRHAFATAAIAPFALVLERKVRPKITFPIFMQMFVLGLLGPVIDQNFYYLGLKYTSPTFSCAMSNMLPAMTFTMAVLCRMEALNLKSFVCQAKLIGTLLTVAGAMLMTLYKGHLVDLFWTHYIHPISIPTTTPAPATSSSSADWLKGSILLILATLAWASFFIVQAVATRRYPAQMSLTALVCGLGTVQSAAVTMVMERRPGAWAVGFDVNLLAAAYAGVVASGIAYYVQGVVMERTGPVFVTAFSPLMMIVVAVMGSFVLAEKIYVGGVMGSVLIVIGLYAVLWGKYKESKKVEEEEEKKNVRLDVYEKGDHYHQQQQQSSETTTTTTKTIQQLAPIDEDLEANTCGTTTTTDQHHYSTFGAASTPMTIGAPLPLPPIFSMEQKST